MAIRHAGDQALAPRRPAAPARHVGSDPGFIDEDEALRVQQRLAFAPENARCGDIRPLADRAEQLHGQLSAGKKPKAKEIRALAEDIRKRVRSM